MRLLTWPSSNTPRSLQTQKSHLSLPSLPRLLQFRLKIQGVKTKSTLEFRQRLSAHSDQKQSLLRHETPPVPYPKPYKDSQPCSDQRAASKFKPETLPFQRRDTPPRPGRKLHTWSGPGQVPRTSFWGQVCAAEQLRGFKAQLESFKNQRSFKPQSRRGCMSNKDLQINSYRV